MNTIPNPDWPNNADVDRMQHQLLHSVRAHNVRKKRRQRVQAAAVFAAAAGITAAAIVIPATQEQIQRSAYCYEAADPESNFVQAVGTAGPSFDGSAKMAIDMCSVGWADGAMAAENDKVGQVPPLGACLRPDNVIGVFPLIKDGKLLTNEELCSELDLRFAP